MIEISVIVPVFNAAPWIARCVDSLLNQDFDPARYEVILVDNNSSDRSLELLPVTSSIQLLTEPVQGSYSARNTGVRHASGRLLAFTDADCVADKNWLSSIEQGLQTHGSGQPQVHLLLGSRSFQTTSGILQRLAAYENARVSYIFGNHRKAAYFAFTNNMAVRRTAFERHGPFDEVSRGGDTLFLHNLVLAEGPGAATWAPAMHVTHLELSSTWEFLHKNFLYARARKQTIEIGQCEPLPWRESVAIALEVCRARPWQEVLRLAIVLVSGRLLFLAGSAL